MNQSSLEKGQTPTLNDTPRSVARIPALDGWRAVAIVLVLIDHATEAAQSGTIHKLGRLGATGVGLFFAISGFLITSRLLAEHRKRGRINLKSFYLRRVFRLLPASVVYLGVLAALTLGGWIAVTRSQILSSVLLYRNYLPASQGDSGWFTVHFWSLNVEEHFYLLWPILLLFTMRRLFVPVALALAVAAWRFADLHLHIVSSAAWFPGRTDIRLDALLWGCILALIVNVPNRKERLVRILNAPLVLVLLAIDAFSNIQNGQHNYSWFEPIILALVVLWPVLRPTSLAGRILEWAPLQWVGRLSYSLYIWQQLWLLFPGDPAPFGRLQQFPLNLLAAMGCAVLSYYLVEKPMISLGHRLTKRQNTGSAKVPKSAKLDFSPLELLGNTGGHNVSASAPSSREGL